MNLIAQCKLFEYYYMIEIYGQELHKAYIAAKVKVQPMHFFKMKMQQQI